MRYIITLLFNSGVVLERFSDSASVDHYFTWYPSLASVTVEEI